MVLVFALGGCGQLDFAAGPLLYDVKVEPDHITPNADGKQDVTGILYSLRRTANVSIYFDNAQGQRFFFRHDRRRSAGEYHVQWGGVVDEARTIQTSYGPVEILSQVLPDGQYRWTLEAADEATNEATLANGKPETVSGTIALQNGDTTLPELHNLRGRAPDFYPQPGWH